MSAQAAKKHRLVETSEASMMDQYIPDHVRARVEGMVNKAQEVVGQVATKGAEIYEQHVEPNVGPAIKFVSEKHNENPEIVNIAVAAVALVYGGCFPRMVLLYATYLAMNSGKDGVIDELTDLYKKSAAAKGSMRAKLIAMFSKSDPVALNALISRVASKLCVVVAILVSPLFAAVVISSAILSLDKTPVTMATAKLKKAAFADKEKWAPVVAKWGLVGAVAGFTWLFPNISAAVFIGYNGGVMVAEKIGEKYMKTLKEDQIRHMGMGLAGASVFLQWYYSFAVGYHLIGFPLYIIMYPFFVVESLL